MMRLKRTFIVLGRGKSLMLACAPRGVRQSPFFHSRTGTRGRRLDDCKRRRYEWRSFSAPFRSRCAVQRLPTALLRSLTKAATMHCADVYPL